VPRSVENRAWAKPDHQLKKQGSRKLYRVGTKQNLKNMISDVIVKGSLIEVYDANSKRISYMSESNKKVVGVASAFFVVVNGSLIEVYDEKCKRISYMSQSNKIVKGAAGNTFIVENGSLIETYDEKCKRISYKSA
jgi:catabolite regulation protein CreA